MAEVAETSMQAFKKKKREGSLDSDRAQVMWLIKEYGPITAKELQMWLGKPKHTFSGRITELQNKNVIECTGVKDGHKQWVKN